MGVEEEQIRILRKQNWQARQKIGTLEKEVERLRAIVAGREEATKAMVDNGIAMIDFIAKHEALLATAKALEAVASTHQWMHDEIGADQLRVALVAAREAIAAYEENT